MLDQGSSLLLTGLISIGYQAGFLSAPEDTARAALPALGLDLDGIIYGTDFHDLWGQVTVPYGIVALDQSTGQKYVAFRGTDSVEEWAEDAWAIPAPWPFSTAPGVRTHKGFSDLYSTLTLAGKPVLASLGMESKPVVTGHSLGGALAYLLGAALGPLAASVVTFESPRVGDLAFCNWMDSLVPNHFRYVIIGDLVPHAPPELLGYFHAGIEIEMDPGTLIPHNPDALHIISSVQTLIMAAQQSPAVTPPAVQAAISSPPILGCPSP